MNEMSTLQIILGIVLLLAAIFLIVAIMLQDKAKRGLSGAIAGGSDNNNYLGNKNGTAPQKGKLLSKVTTIVAIVFAVVVVVAYLFS
ncbi:MAG: preprotein translocase subunit SecG [Clostridia bacterium]|nr:preprotein translocase subunit SecG [Clostridia bacterium]